MTDTTMPELLPCPFCGGKALIGETLDYFWYAMCAKDDCLQLLNHFATKAEAITAWNTIAALADHQSTPEPVAWQRRVAHHPTPEVFRWENCPKGESLPNYEYRALYAASPHKMAEVEAAFKATAEAAAFHCKAAMDAKAELAVAREGL